MLRYFSIREQKRELELSIDRQRKRLYKNEIMLEQRYWILERNMILNLETENRDLKLKIETDEQNLSHSSDGCLEECPGLQRIKSPLVLRGIHTRTRNEPAR